VLFNLYLLRLGYGPETVGLVNGVGLLAYAVFAFPAGVVSGWLGIRRALVIGALLSIVGFGLHPLVEFVPSQWSVAWLLGNRIYATAGLALYFVNSTPFLANATAPGERAHAYSIRMVFDTLSGFLGSLVGGALPGLLAPWMMADLTQAAPYRVALLIGAALGLPAVLALFLVRDSGENEREGIDETAPAGAVPISILAVMAVVVLLRAAGVGTSRTFFNVYLDDALGASTGQIGVLFAVIQLLSVPAALAMPVLSERWGHYRVVVWASLGMAASMLPLALVPHWAAATVGRIGTYALSAIADPAIGLYQMELVRPRWRSVMSGVTGTALGLSWTALAFGGGYLITSLGYRPLFLLAGLMTAGGTVLFWAFFRREHVGSGHCPT
jgi:MFS family permease